MLVAPLRYAGPSVHHFAPIASSSRTIYATTPFRSMIAVRQAHAVPRPRTEAGFEGVPAPAYSGTVEDVKGKQKESPQTATKLAAPRRKIEIKAKKAAISMVSTCPIC